MATRATSHTRRKSIGGTRKSRKSAYLNTAYGFNDKQWELAIEREHVRNEIAKLMKKDEELGGQIRYAKMRENAATRRFREAEFGVRRERHNRTLEAEYAHQRRVRGY